MNKVFKVPVIIGVIVFLISFVSSFFTEMPSIGYTLENILLAFFGALIIGFVPFFIALIVSYIYHASKEKKS